MSEEKKLVRGCCVCHRIYKNLRWTSITNEEYFALMKDRGMTHTYCTECKRSLEVKGLHLR